MRKYLDATMIMAIVGFVLGCVGVILALSATGCAHLEPKSQAPRDEIAQRRAAAAITSDCGDGLSPSKVGNGVVISERHVLTAAHVVRCAALPTVRAYFGEVDGRHGRRMVVVREDLDADIALLEVADAGNFERGVAPPVVDWEMEDNSGCAQLQFPRGEARCGELSLRYWIEGGRTRWQPALDVPAERGISGAGVYGASGALLGIVTGGNERRAAFARVTRAWLRGVK